MSQTEAPWGGRTRRKRRPGRLWAGVLCLLMCASLVACTGDASNDTPRRRALLIGIDGAAPRVVRRLMIEGRLPNLTHLASLGLFSLIQSAPPYVSPRLWNSIATGKVPKKHGIESFTRKVGEQQVPLLSSDRKVPALWNIVSDAGLSVAVINWWNTYPPERIDGIMVSDHARIEGDDKRIGESAETSPARGALVHPVAWSERLESLLADDSPVVAFEDPFSAEPDLPRQGKGPALPRVFRADMATTRVALAAEREFSPDLMMVFLPGIDRVSHRLWGSFEPIEDYDESHRPTPAQHAAGARALTAYYEYTDALIGVLVERFAKDDLVLVLSDHGFERAAADAFLTGTHWSAKAGRGVLFARGDAIGKGSSTGRRVTLNDITPTLLAWFGLPVARDMDGSPAPFLQVPAVETVASYDGASIERLDALPSSNEDEILEELRALGYIE